jgi:glycosyltransferase involved in cell wall biosynthesis
MVGAREAALQMNILIVHPNMPGQFLRLAPHLAAKGHRVAFLTARVARELPAIGRILYTIPAATEAERGVHGYAEAFQDAVRHGIGAAKALKEAVDKGYRPDLIIAHNGWGDPLFLKDILPKVRMIVYSEFYDIGKGGFRGFDPEEPHNIDAVLRARTKAASKALAVLAAEASVTATQWQRSLHPEALRRDMQVIFDGIDTKAAAPDSEAILQLPGLALKQGDPIVTYIARNLEPCRGFRTFMRAVPLIQELSPEARIVIVGGDAVSYGRRAPKHPNWRAAMEAEVDYDRSRVTFLPHLPYADYLSLLKVSAAHIYLTWPFVASWSLAEAMSSACAVIGSDTPPVREFIQDRTNGLLVDFFSPAQVAAAVAEILASPASFARMRAAARETIVATYAAAPCLARWDALIGKVMKSPVLAVPGPMPR